MKNIRPVVSICCTTFNHVNYIADALNGFLEQETDFPFEILVHDDASTDGTADVVRQYERRYPDLIKPIYQHENQYSQGRKTSRYNYNRARGRYIALCEGDDYWSDPKKLQKQVDFLDSHPDVYLCGHAVRQIDEHGNTMLDSKFGIYDDMFLSPEDMAFGHLGFPTLSVVFRNAATVPTFRVINSDTMTFAYFSNLGRGYISREVMGVYRVHPGGVWSARDAAQQVELTIETLSQLPAVIAPARRSLAYLNLLRYAVKEDPNRQRGLRNAASAAAMAAVWLRPTSAGYLMREVWKRSRRRRKPFGHRSGDWTRPEPSSQS